MFVLGGLLLELLRCCDRLSRLVLLYALGFWWIDRFVYLGVHLVCLSGSGFLLGLAGALYFGGLKVLGFGLVDILGGLGVLQLLVLDSYQGVGIIEVRGILCVQKPCASSTLLAVRSLELRDILDVFLRDTPPMLDEWQLLLVVPHHFGSSISLLASAGAVPFADQILLIAYLGGLLVDAYQHGLEV